MLQGGTKKFSFCYIFGINNRRRQKRRRASTAVQRGLSNIAVDESQAAIFLMLRILQRLIFPHSSNLGGKIKEPVFYFCVSRNNKQPMLRLFNGRKNRHWNKKYLATDEMILCIFTAHEKPCI